MRGASQFSACLSASTGQPRRAEVGDAGQRPQRDLPHVGVLGAGGADGLEQGGHRLGVAHPAGDSAAKARSRHSLAVRMRSMYSDQAEPS